MSSEEKFLLDTDVFTQAGRLYYRFSVARTFWESIKKSAEAGRIWTIDIVRDEIYRGGDDVADWLRNEFPSSRILSTADTDVSRSFAPIMTWVTNHAHFSQANKNKFASDADGWLVALAKARGFTVVTQEALVTDPKTKKIKIPNTCKQFSVNFRNTYEMLEELGISF